MEPELAHQRPEVIKDERAIKEVVSKVKSQGLFDQFRKECIADVDTKPAYHNLLQRVESYVEHFLQEQKWSSIANKNQLRETLRRQLNNSGMMHNGVERIIEQVVNPKILLGIKPKIDEAVSDHLGIDLKARQEEQQRRKQEQQRLLLQQQQQLQQQNLQAQINQNVKPGDGFDTANNQPPFGNMGPWGPGMANFPSPSVQGVGNPITGMPGNPQCMMNFPGMAQPFSMMGGWSPGFNPAMQPMIPGQPMIPVFPGAGMPPSGPGISPFNANISPATGTIATSTPPATGPVIPDLSKPPPGIPNTSSTSTTRSPIVHPGTVSINRAPPGSIPPPPGTVPVIPPSSSSLVPPGTSPVVPTRAVPTTPTIPALISHTLAKVSENKLTPEKIAVFKTAAAIITKTVSNAQGTPGADLATMFSPRVLAEAMKEESGKPMTKHELRAVRRKERLKEMERLRAERELEVSRKSKTEDKEDPLPPKHNLMDVFQGAEDVSDDEEALDMLMDVDEAEDRHKSGIILSDESDKEGTEQPPTSQPGKRYNFAWDVDINPEELSDVTLSSIHTSDISSYEEDLSSSESDHEIEKPPIEILEAANETENKEALKENAECTSLEEMSSENLNKSQEELTEEKPKEESLSVNAQETELLEEKKEDVLSVTPDPKPESTLPVTEEIAKPLQQNQSLKPRKLLALSSHFSDSDDDETREDRKARIAREKEERYLKRQQRRAELEAKRKERDEEKTRLKEEKKRQKELATDTKPDEMAAPSEPAIPEEQSVATTPSEQESILKATPKRKKNKAEMKEQLLQQKVMERKAALKRRRTRNRRYASDEFTTIFSERKTLNEGYTDDVINPDELVTFDGTVEVVEMTVDQECVVETISEVIETCEDMDQPGQELILQCPSPYSDISDRSMSDKSDLSQADNVSVDKISSEEELDDDIEIKRAIEEMVACAKDEVSSSSHSVLKSVEGYFQQDGVNSTASEPISPRARLSPHSKFAVSQEEFENTSSIPDEKSSQKSTGVSHLEEDKESQISLNDGEPSPLKPAVFDNASTATMDMEADNADVKDIMADLELEPVSDEDSSLGGMSDIESQKDKEEGEEKDSDGEMHSPPPSDEEKTEQKGDVKIEDDNASDEGEIKSDSEEEQKRNPQLQVTKREEANPRPIAKKPIQFVDFGEAEKRARGSRVFFSESDRRRASASVSSTSSGYRGSYTQWPSSGGSSLGAYPSSTGRYTIDTSSPARSKSPGAAFDAESETSSHSRSSVRIRDDVPLPYPMEGITRKLKSSSATTQGTSGLYKPVSPPSPVSSSSSLTSRSRHSRSRSKSRSRSRSSSRSNSSDSYSSASHSSSRKRKRSKKKKKRKRRSARSKSKDGAPSVRSHSPSSRTSFPERPSPSRRLLAMSLPAAATVPKSLAESCHLSSGNESISSDELPYFPDEEAENPPNSSQSKSRRLSGGSNSSNYSSSSGSKRPDSPGKASISSSELIYSPTRKRVRSGGSNASGSNEHRRPHKRKSSSRHSASSNENPISPKIETDLVYSPHRPSSPTGYPILPDDMSGFQPPLPQETHDHPPLPCSQHPPLPPEEVTVPLPPHIPPPPLPPPPPDEVEEGECPSTPEYEEQEDKSSNIEHEAPPYSPLDGTKEVDNEGLSKVSTSATYEESVDSLEIMEHRADSNADIEDRAPPCSALEGTKEAKIEGLSKVSTSATFEESVDSLENKEHHAETNADIEDRAPLDSPVEGIKEAKIEGLSNVSISATFEESVDFSENREHQDSNLPADPEGSSVDQSNSVKTALSSFQSCDSDLTHSNSPSIAQENGDKELKSPETPSNFNNVDELREAGEKDDELKERESSSKDYFCQQKSESDDSHQEKPFTADTPETDCVEPSERESRTCTDMNSPSREMFKQSSTDSHEVDLEESDLSSSKGVKRTVEDCGSPSDTSPPAKRQKEMGEDENI